MGFRMPRPRCPISASRCRWGVSEWTREHPGHDLPRAVQRDPLARPAVRRAVRHRRALHGDLLPAELPRAHTEGVERHLLRDERRRPRGRLPRVQALPSRGGTRLARMGCARRHIGSRHAAHRRRRGRARRGPGPRPPTRLLTAPPDAPAHRRAGRGSARPQPRAPRAHGPHAPRRHRPARRRSAHAVGPVSAVPEAPGSLDLVLPHRGPLDAAGLFAWMAARAIPGVETATDQSFSRTLRLDGGPAWFELRLDDAGHVRLRARLTALRDLPAVVARARRLFDLDADPIAVDEALAQHRELAPLVAGLPGIRVPGAVDPHEMLVRAMVGQQITVSAARTAL